MNSLQNLRPLALVAAALTLTTTLRADPGSRAPHGDRPGRGLPTELRQKYDANGDGQLDASERAALHADVESGQV
ncbi:MAG: hypothetical protein ACKO3N_17310, partial [Verrucomicrobiota bacterium]